MSVKKIIVFTGLVIFALFIVGFFTGAIGSAFLGDPEAGLLSKPKVHLPPQPVLPDAAREHFIEYEEGHASSPFASKSAFVLTNTLLSSWITTAILIFIFLLGVFRLKLVPGRIQGFVELMVESILSAIESVIGKEHGRKFFPFITTLFLFVLCNAWIGLLPIYPAIGWIDHGHVEVHLLRPAGTDVNMPLALALLSFIYVEFWGLKILGISYISKFIRIDSLKKGTIALFRGKLMDAFQYYLDFFFIGPLEAFSELTRILSFTFRLFGNMTAGEILVLVSAFLVSFVATVLVYGLELLVGFIQALIFAGLTLVFASMAIAPHSEEDH